MPTVQTECKSCGGTGVYRGFAEPEGVAVVCLNCSGTGCEVLRYTTFTVRQRRKGIDVVRISQGALLCTGVGPTGGVVTYDDFLKGTMPTTPK